MINRERLVQTFCDLVRIDSPSGEEEAMAQELTKRLTVLGFNVARDAHGNLIASEKGERPLMLSAHMDTVEPGRGIKPRVGPERIESDGTTILGGDCKAGIAAILEGLTAIRESKAHRRTLQVVITRGEEIGLVGARNLDFSMIQAKEAMVFDGNGPVAKITNASPTYMRFQVHVKGRAAHAGVEPEKGLSAIRIATEIISRFPQGRIDGQTTFNVGTIHGGTVRNAVPEDTTFVGEFRSHNTETFDLLRLQLLEIIDGARKKYRDAIISDELEVEFESYSLLAQDPMVVSAVQVMASLGIRAEIGPSGGGTDANIFNQHGVRCVVVGMSTNDMHTVREYVVIRDLVDTARFCEALLLHS